MKATIIADASHCPNTKIGGYGIWVALDGKRIQKSGVIKGLVQNATYAELKAVMIGIWYAYQHGARELLVQTDCMTVVQVLKGELHAGQAELRRVFNTAMAKECPGIVIAAKHVKGHTNVQDKRSYVNRWCDKVAGEAMRASRDKTYGKRAKNSNTGRIMKCKQLPPALVRDTNPAVKKSRPTSESFKNAMLNLSTTVKAP